ncbi:MAG: formylmethanofuran dehydrogenase subunit C [Candidatus Altiarchaeum hamiconexum]|uniref:formylmethanofuran dehydrogenase n=1 Tax=Candidatus Altarchaeum hamiconexum TaxID=1803513 RepID=A0A8J7YZF1_9ARCH|nr:formylmethanofuran dehydrogenase subunit C [Candidatus Altarchaeum hamiconexum]OIQ04594.1 MAG: formylmethanofuran dehydrogenase subunit C [Candidatus Altarchaeum sp. CG2_30_32_3053]PIN67444.1 MAG: formylmethanofuran dehydrogenase subunit C [Candidatus Altarchaeum sp. CG12_big_fil_rev_8_21_14_0_65_33_22]PIV27798.1 MAG: formylmethanofuran dehydrogenase subunit C [Candidatus Altarchaeum sp. CG03_land_8_20_14_0_80_32_618]PIX49065.1 MAG: formylmethanofuran dehydrogenase subunit C [Candidatus Alta
MIKLIPKFSTTIPVFAENISPDKFSGKSDDEIKNIEIFYGNQKKILSDLFEIYDDSNSRGNNESNEEILIAGDVSMVREIGKGMTKGKITINGNAGMHLGAYMEGGIIEVQGNTDDWLGAEMNGGLIKVSENTGNFAGGAYYGSVKGMEGGIIVIEGNAGNEAGRFMTLGTIVIKGNAGNFAGVHIKGGTIFVFGNLGGRAGAEMHDGTIVTMCPDSNSSGLLLPTFKSNTIAKFSFIYLFLTELRNCGIQIEDKFFGNYERFSGDFAEQGKGEIFLFRG